jgi:hypothetical protein
MKFIARSDFTLSWICFISSLYINEVHCEIRFYAVLNLLHFKLVHQWSILRDQILRCPEFAPFYSLHVNEVDFEIGFQAVMNLLHLIAYASMK